MSSLGVHVQNSFYLTHYHIYVLLVKAFTATFVSYSNSSEGVNLVAGDYLYIFSK